MGVTRVGGGRRQPKATVENYPSLDVRYLKRAGVLGSGSRHVVSWTRRGNRSGSMELVASEDWVELAYSVPSLGGDREDVRQMVWLTWTDCHFGGRRPWFVCPGKGCGRRVAILYAAGRHFLCRHCYDLVYQSQQESEAGRLLLKARRIRCGLGGSGSLVEPFPQKPKGMHWDTYCSLLEQVVDATLQSLNITRSKLFG